MGIPAIFIGASVVIALASLALHFLFPPSSSKWTKKQILRSITVDEEKEKAGRMI